MENQLVLHGYQCYVINKNSLSQTGNAVVNILSLVLDSLVVLWY